MAGPRPHLATIMLAVTVLAAMVAGGCTLPDTVGTAANQALAVGGDKAGLVQAKGLAVAAKAAPVLEYAQTLGKWAWPWVAKYGPYAGAAAGTAVYSNWDQSVRYGVAGQGCRSFADAGRRARCEARANGPRSSNW